MPNIIYGDVPAFRAYNSSSITLVGGGTNTKVLFQTENFDTNNDYDISTSKFTPKISGYYQINSTVTTNTGIGTTQWGMLCIYKNGSIITNGSSSIWIGSNWCTTQVNDFVYMNGSSDYLEIYFYTSYGTNTGTMNTSQHTNFSGFLARSA